MKYSPLQGQVNFCLPWAGIAQLLRILQNALLESKTQVVLVMGSDERLCRSLQQAWNIAAEAVVNHSEQLGCRWINAAALPPGSHSSLVVLSSQLNLWVSLTETVAPLEMQRSSIFPPCQTALWTVTLIVNEQTIAALLQHPLIESALTEFSELPAVDSGASSFQTLRQIWLQLLPLALNQSSDPAVLNDVLSESTVFEPVLPIDVQSLAISPNILETQQPDHDLSVAASADSLNECKPTTSVDYFRWFLSDSADIYAEFDRTLKYRFINAAGAQLLGLSTTEIVGKTNPALLGEVAASIDPVIRQTFATGTKVVVSHEISHLGRYRVFETLYVPIWKSPVQCVISISRDITELKQRWQWLDSQNRELTETSRLKQEFIATTSHELRTPLTAILGFSNILLQEFFGNLNLKQKDYLERIHTSGRHLLELINDILDLSRIEADRLEMELELVSISDLCESVVSVMRERSTSQGLTLEVDLANNLDHMVADPRRLKQMLFNLLSNAIKFTPDGSVGLKVYRTSTEPTENLDSVSHPGVGEDARPAQPSEQIHFLVWDTGIGINETDQKRLFRPFAQIDSPLARKQQGSGLGLVITRKLAELHGGKILLESKTGHGSNFILSLPLHRSVQSLQQASPQTITQNAGVNS
jgi:PAS domain S-box-containing protein